LSVLNGVDGEKKDDWRCWQLRVLLGWFIVIVGSEEGKI